MRPRMPLVVPPVVPGTRSKECRRGCLRQRSGRRRGSRWQGQGVVPRISAPTPEPRRGHQRTKGAAGAATVAGAAGAAGAAAATWTKADGTTVPACPRVRTSRCPAMPSRRGSRSRATQIPACTTPRIARLQGDDREIWFATEADAEAAGFKVRVIQHNRRGPAPDGCRARGTCTVDVAVIGVGPGGPRQITLGPSTHWTVSTPWCCSTRVSPPRRCGGCAPDARALRARLRRPRRRRSAA